jgi:hypothetical protein
MINDDHRCGIESVVKRLAISVLFSPLSQNVEVPADADDDQNVCDQTSLRHSSQCHLDRFELEVICRFAWIKISVFIFYKIIFI